MNTYPNTQLFINGQWRDATSGRTIPVIDPATEAEIGVVASAGRGDLDLALDAAAKGFAVWGVSAVFERSKLMRKAANLLRERVDAIAAIMTMEQGKPLSQARAEILGGADTIDWFAEEARRIYGQVIPARAPGITQIVKKFPVGPVAAFSPWNFPINQALRKISAALATGCSIILKGPEETPASPAALVQCFADAGIPDGVINLVYGVPSEISEYLIPHPVIKKISFTGSTVVGKHLASLAGLHMKRATMELGGHAPVLVFDDADVDTAVKLMATNKVRNAGQVCISPTRMLVQAGVADRFIEGFTAATRTMKVGSGFDEGVDMGPLANDRRIPAMEALIQDALDHGATLKTGGRRIGNKGYFFEPTVLTDVPAEARVMNEEPFGPLAIINRFDTFDSAISEANRLPYGLASFAFTSSSATSQALGDQIQAGMLSINHLGLGLPELPFGGINDSGYGSEGGSDATDAYLTTRMITQKG